ncbi:MAG: cytochrome c-type biogenesis protein, partial [Pseudomonadota bacterium]
NQSIDESDAELARDLRNLVRERLQAGEHEHQILDYLRTRYGDFILLKPPLNHRTWPLWAGPFLVLGGALWWFYRRARIRNGDAPYPSHDDKNDTV